MDLFPGVKLPAKTELSLKGVCLWEREAGWVISSFLVSSPLPWNKNISWGYFQEKNKGAKTAFRFGVCAHQECRRICFIYPHKAQLVVCGRNGRISTASQVNGAQSLRGEERHESRGLVLKTKKPLETAVSLPHAILSEHHVQTAVDWNPSEPCGVEANFPSHYLPSSLTPLLFHFPFPLSPELREIDSVSVSRLRVRYKCSPRRHRFPTPLSVWPSTLKPRILRSHPCTRRHISSYVYLLFNHLELLVFSCETLFLVFKGGFLWEYRPMWPSSFWFNPRHVVNVCRTWLWTQRQEIKQGTTHFLTFFFTYPKYSSCFEECNTRKIILSLSSVLQDPRICFLCC